MPLLPLPSGGSVLTGGDLPVSSEVDVAAVFLSLFRTDDPAPVRDAIIASLTKILLTYQDRAAQAAMQSSILYATGENLSQACAEVGVFRQSGEDDETLRARAITSPQLVTPAAILAAANTVLATYTTKHAQYHEPIQDQWFCRQSNGAWDSYAFQSKGWSPKYPTRLYPSYGGTTVRVDSEVGDIRAYQDSVGRYFVLRVPDLSPIDTSLASVYAEPTKNGFFIGTGNAANATFLHSYSATAQSVYRQIINAVERVKAAGIRWQLLVDKTL